MSIENKVSNFWVDVERQMTPFSMTKRKGEIEKKYTDHLTIGMEICLPARVKIENKKKQPFINYHNKEGWKKYPEIAARYVPEMIEAIRETEDVYELDQKLNTIDDKIQVDSFGLTWKGSNSKPKLKKKSSKELKDMFQEQQEELGIMIGEGLRGKDLNNKIYNMKKLVTGPKIKGNESTAINCPITNNLITNEEEIKKISLEHNIKILTKNKPQEEDKELIKEKQRRHQKMMDRDESIEEWELDRELFTKVDNKIKKKNKNMYKLYNQAGQEYKLAIFEYMKKVIKSEQIPQKYKATTLTQIWKGKGSPLSLNNMRFIHMRGWKPKLLEALITEKMKPKIVEATPKFQLGGMPGASSSEHLVVLKTWMRLKEQNKENGIFNLYDMSKFFDKESLLDCMNVLNTEAGIDPKSYRMWYLLNEDTDIRVKTSVGLSMFARIKDSIGQGSVGAALVSSLNIGSAIEKTFKDNKSTFIGRVGLNSLIFQDDISKMNENLDQAREGCIMIDRTLKQKLLSLNYDKSRFLIIGSEKFRKKTLKEVEKNPMKMGSGVVSHSESEKYLGDLINEKGCEQSITDTIKERTRKLKSKCDDIIQIAESPLMGGLNCGSVAFKLYEAQIISSLLHNSESWIGINDKHIQLLQKFQDEFIRKVLRLPSSAPKAIMQYDTGLWPMEWRIKYKKLNFVRGIMLKPSSNITKKILYQEFLNKIDGLATECNRICIDLNIDFLLTNTLTKQYIKRAVQNRIKIDNETAMLNSKKVNDRLFIDDQANNFYLNTMSIAHCRLWFRYRARGIVGVKANTKSTYSDLSCRYCNGESTENQEHLEVCDGFRFERRGLNMDSVSGKLTFWRRCGGKLTAVAGGSPSGE